MSRILVVDDDPDVAEWVAHVVAAPDHDVRAVGSPAAVRDLWDHEDYAADLVLLDYDLPGVDGVELLAEVRRHWPRVACVFVTVLWTGEILDRIAATGSERVAKPFEPATLQDAVARALAGSGGTR